MNNKQRLKASYTLVMVLMLTASITLLVEYKFMETWLALFFILCVPAQVAMGELLNAKSNNLLSSLSQPFKGVIITTICALLAGGYTLILFNTVGGGIHSPGPPLLSYSIVVVAMTFWYVIVWDCWPISITIHSAYWRCLSILILPFFIGYIAYYWLFDFSFLQGTPSYESSLDPKGLFTSWYVIAFLITTVAVLFSLSLFEVKLFSVYSDRPFLRGIASSLFILTISSGVYFFAIFTIKLDPVVYLVNGPITYIFGMFIPLNLFKGRLFKYVEQPQKGIYLVVLSLLAGGSLNILYTLFFMYFFPSLVKINQSYVLELWMANAMLAFSFPILITLTDHFDFWPFKNDV